MFFNNGSSDGPESKEAVDDGKDEIAAAVADVHIECTGGQAVALLEPGRAMSLSSPV